MKNNKGITLVALIVTILVMIIIVGISVGGGGDILQKAKMTDYIGYMKLVKARADVVLEEIAFENSLGTETITDSNINELIDGKGYSDYILKKWDRDKIATQGIDENILGENQYFLIVFNATTMETIDVIYSAGCGFDGNRYYSLNDMEKVVSGETPIVQTN